MSESEYLPSAKILGRVGVQAEVRHTPSYLLADSTCPYKNYHQCLIISDEAVERGTKRKHEDDEDDNS